MNTAENQMTLEELDSIRAYDAAKASGDEVVPFEQALQEISESEAWHGKRGRVRTSRTKRTQGT
jgi:hypothetical protein